jgi:hypothetical protein
MDDDCEVEVNGHWQLIGIGAALAMKRPMFMRCPECKGQVSAHAAAVLNAIESRLRRREG